MRKIVVFNYISLDGFIAGPNGEIDWFAWDDETAQYSKELADSFDTMLFGRVTYELMAGYWPTVTTEDPIITENMNNSSKIVFSRTLDKADWNNTRLVREILPEEISKMKQQPGKDMVIFGSGSIVAHLTQLDLIDDYRMLVNPVILGSGIRQFSDKNTTQLKLVESKTFTIGLVMLHYQLHHQ